MTRVARIRTLRKAVGGRQAAFLANAGALAATEYGASVNGDSDTELGKLRTLATAGMSPRPQGRSLAGVLALKGHPAARAAFAPIAQ